MRHWWDQFCHFAHCNTTESWTFVISNSSLTYNHKIYAKYYTRCALVLQSIHILVTGADTSAHWKNPLYRSPEGTQNALWRRTHILQIERTSRNRTLCYEALLYFLIFESNKKKTLHITYWSDCSSQNSRSQSKFPVVLCLTNFASPLGK